MSEGFKGTLTFSDEYRELFSSNDPEQLHATAEEQLMAFLSNPDLKTLGEVAPTEALLMTTLTFSMFAYLEARAAYLAAQAELKEEK